MNKNDARRLGGGAQREEWKRCTCGGPARLRSVVDVTAEQLANSLRHSWVNRAGNTDVAFVSTHPARPGHAGRSAQSPAARPDWGMQWSTASNREDCDLYLAHSSGQAA